VIPVAPSLLPVSLEESIVLPPILRSVVHCLSMVGPLEENHAALWMLRRRATTKRSARRSTM